jgi:hypothetical protein
VKSQTPRLRADIRETAGLQAPCDPSRSPTPCLPCRRSRVRIPSAALKKVCICRPFCVRSRLVRLRRVGLTPDSPRADRRPFQEKRPVCRSILVRPNRSPSAGLQKVGCSACCGRYPDSCCNGTILRTAPAGAIPAVAVLGGQSGFSPETARSTSTRSATPASHGTESREPQDGIRGTGAVPITGSLCPGSHTAVIAEGVAFHRQAGDRAHLGCWLSSTAGATRRGFETLASRALR